QDAVGAPLAYDVARIDGPPRRADGEQRSVPRCSDDRLAFAAPALGEPHARRCDHWPLLQAAAVLLSGSLGVRALRRAEVACAWSHRQSFEAGRDLLSARTRRGARRRANSLRIPPDASGWCAASRG